MSDPQRPHGLQPSRLLLIHGIFQARVLEWGMVGTKIHKFNLVFNIFGLLSKEVANCLEKEMANHFSILALRTS